MGGGKSHGRGGGARVMCVCGGGQESQGGKNHLCAEQESLMRGTRITCVGDKTHMCGGQESHLWEGGGKNHLCGGQESHP